MSDTAPEEAKQIVGGFIRGSKGIMYGRMETALRQISRLHWWERWKAKRIAQQALGTGPYWNQEFKAK